MKPTTPEGAGHPARYIYDHHDESITFDEPLTYYEHIKPIVDANCMGCHMTGQIAGDIICMNLARAFRLH